MRIAEVSFLVVEDHEFQRRVLLRILESLGATKAATAQDGSEALAIVMARNPPIDIIISDIQMPRMNGEAFMRELGEAGILISIILVSALGGQLLASVEALTKSYGVRLLGVIEKPVTPAKLGALIELHQPTGKGTAVATSTLDDVVEGLKSTIDQFFRIVHLAPPVDRAVLAAISGDDAAIARKMLWDFRRVNENDAALLAIAVQDRDTPQVINTSDHIRGASSMIGASALAEICGRIGRAGAAGDWDAIQTDMGAFQRELGRLHAYCDAA